VLVAGYGALPSPESEAARELFEATRKLLAQQLFDQLQGKP